MVYLSLHQNTEDSSRKWSVCGSIICDTGIFEICGHRLEVFTLVSEIFDNVDMVLGIKNIFQLEGIIDSHE